MAGDGERAFAVEDFLYALIVGAQSTTLSGIVSVERAVPPQLNTFPAAGVAFMSWDSEPLGMGSPTYQRAATFELSIAVRQQWSPAAADTVQQARLALRNYVDSGTGLGLVPLLEANPTCGGLVQGSWISRLEYRAYISDDSTAGTIAEAHFTFRCNYRTT